MERAKFDDLIRDKIDTQDQNFTRPYNREKCWNAISRKKSNKIGYQISAAIAIAAIVSIFYLRIDHLPIVNEMSKMTRENRIDSLPNSLQRLNKAVVPAIKLPVKQHTSQKNLVVGESINSLENNKPDTAVTRFTQIVQNSKPASINSADTATESTGIKITFKRGVQIGEKDIKVSLAKGQKVKFEFFKKEQHDSTAYVLNQNNKSKQSIRLHF